MGIRYEKDSILNWINEMGKFLRLLIDCWESFDAETDHSLIEDGYKEFFNANRSVFLDYTIADLKKYVSENLQIEQIRPLALLFLYDGLLCDKKDEQQNLLTMAKYLLDDVAQQTGSFSFEDFGHLKTIGDHLE